LRRARPRACARVKYIHKCEICLCVRVCVNGRVAKSCLFSSARVHLRVWVCVRARAQRRLCSREKEGDNRVELLGLCA